MIKLMVWIATAAALLLTVDGAWAQGGVDDPAQIEQGMAIYETNCATCHVSDGSGSNAGRPLTDIAAEQPDRSVHVTSVTDGKGRMPAWNATLTAEEIDAVVSYVRLGFSTQEAEAAAEAEGEGEAAEEELAVTGSDIELGVLAAAALLGAGLLFVRSARLHPRRS